MTGLLQSEVGIFRWTHVDVSPLLEEGLPLLFLVLGAVGVEDDAHPQRTFSNENTVIAAKSEVV